MTAPGYGVRNVFSRKYLFRGERMCAFPFPLLLFQHASGCQLQPWMMPLVQNLTDNLERLVTSGAAYQIIAVCWTLYSTDTRAGLCLEERGNDGGTTDIISQTALQQLNLVCDLRDEPGRECVLTIIIMIIKITCGHDCDYYWRAVQHRVPHSQKQINKWKQSIQPEAVHAPRLQHQGQLRGTSPSQGFV